MKKRTSILLGVIVFMFGLLFLLPSTPGMKPSRLSKNLPEDFENWLGVPREPGELEKKVLAKDTEFRRMEYRDKNRKSPSIEASIVFSGKNLSQSIHRPEVCFRAQGWTFVHENYLSLDGILPDGHLLPVKEMICKRPAMMGSAEEGGVPTPYLNKDGEQVFLWRVFYYTFFGHEEIVAGHYERTLSDMKDRLIGGYDQRWAYATFSSFITSKYADQGLVSPDVETFDENETKVLLVDFLKELLPKIVADPGQGYDESLVNGEDLGL